MSSKVLAFLAEAEQESNLSAEAETQLDRLFPRGTDRTAAPVEDEPEPECDGDDFAHATLPLGDDADDAAAHQRFFNIAVGFAIPATQVPPGTPAATATPLGFARPA